ncbi:MAG TPA: di-heme oxidoredictase family protein [Blastocatellia bacterium]|nr:di-heme oxidoredictase family protein [Blastocatellia bacterium]
MSATKQSKVLVLLLFAASVAFLSIPALAQLADITRTPNSADQGICKSFTDQVGAGRGNLSTLNSSLFLINRDPFRSIRRGRQVFHRKFARSQGQGPMVQDGEGPQLDDIHKNAGLGAGLGDSCAICHARPRGSAGFGSDVATRPDSRDAPHLFGLGLKEMLADEITTDLRGIRKQAILQAQQTNQIVTKPLNSKGINYGQITATPNGSVNYSQVQGVDVPSLRIRPFFLHGATISIREFVNGAFQNEMGLQAVDPDTTAAAAGATVTTPSGMVLNGSQDTIEKPPTDNPNADPDGDGVANEIPLSIVDFMEHYLLNYFAAGTYQPDITANDGRALFISIGCAQCHVPDLQINRDRRVASFETKYDPTNGNPFNHLFGTHTALFNVIQDPPFPPLKKPKLQPFLVKDIYTDFKRHDLGPNFHEINYDGSVRTEFLTMALHGVGTTAPYGHDGRSQNLIEVILRHGKEAQDSRDKFIDLSLTLRNKVLTFLSSLVLFPPDDTASTLNGINPNCNTIDQTRCQAFTPPFGTVSFPQCGHGGFKLSALFNNPNDAE